MRPASSVVTFGIRFAGATALAATCAVLAAACGSRGPLDDYSDLLDASNAADVASVDVVTVEDAAPADTGANRDAGRGDGSASPIDCGVCLVSQCSTAILACVTSPGCQKTFQCVITDCAGGGGKGGGGGAGGFDPICLFKCASGDAQGALQILQIFQCVTGKCGDDCGGLLGGLLGGGGFPGVPGGGGSSGSSGGGGKQYTPAQREFMKAFSAWPELSSQQ